MRLSARTFALAFACLALVLAAPAQAAIGTYGSPATGTTASVVGVLTPFATANIGFFDNNPTDAAVATTEAIVLSFFGDNVIHQNDIVLSPGNGLTTACVSTCAAGSTISNAPAGALVYSVPAPVVVTPLNSLLRYVDTLPTYAQGGPDGAFNPGEPLFLDLDGSLGPSAQDRLLTSGAGVSGSPGGAVSGTQSETIWDNTSECIYASVDATSDGLDGLVTADDAGSCPALGATLLAVSGIKITGGNAILDAGEEAYISASATPANGDYRLTDVGAFSSGTVVSCGATFGADADCGVAPLTALANTKITLGSRSYALPLTPFAYFDNNGNSAYDSTDRVLLDGDNDNFATPADVRVNTAGAQTFGARPAFGNSEVHAVFGGVLTPTMMWLESGTNPTQIDSTEPLALHFGAGLTLAIGDVCLTAVGGCQAGGQRISTSTAPTTGGTWTDASTATNAPAMGYSDANNNNKYDIGDGLYLHFGALPANTAAGDIQIASDTGTTGTRLTTTGVALKALPGGFVPTYRSFDLDGGGTFSVGDPLYLARTAGTTVASPGEIRISTATGLTGFGKNVKEGDADAVIVLTDLTASGTLLGFRDLDGSGGVLPSTEDAIFMMPRAAATCPLVGPDVVLSPGILAGATAGAFVGASTVTCTDIGGTPEFAYMPVGVYNTNSLVYVDLDGDGTLETGDIRLTGGTNGASGGRITGSSTVEINSPVTGITLGTPTISYADVSGDAVAAANEAVVLDMTGDGFFTPGDVPLSGSGTASTGGGGGGGGGGTVPNPSPSTSASSSTSATNTSSTSSTSSSSTSSSPTGSGASAASLNLQLQASLEVERDGTDNVLTWDDVSGESAYQVFGSTSPYALLAELPAGTTTYRDEDAAADTKYLVTACVGPCSLSEDDVNEGDVPGYSEVPEGEGRPEGKKGFIPGPAPALVILALAGLALLARRRLA